jgi:hypothetical protein
MPEIKFTLSTQNATRLANAYAFLYDYKKKVGINEEQIDNPESKNQFAKRMLLEEMKNKVKGYESDVAKKALPEPDEIEIA